MGDGYVVQEIPAPRSFVGRTLRELDLRARYGVQVIFIRTRESPDGTSNLNVPTAESRVRAMDTLLVAGPKQAADALQML